MLVFSLFVVKVELRWIKRLGLDHLLFRIFPEKKKGEDPGDKPRPSPLSEKSCVKFISFEDQALLRGHQ